MKFKYTNWRGVFGPFTGEEAVKFEMSCQEGAEYDAVRTLAGIVGRSVDVLPPNKAAEVLGPGWSVDDER